MTLLSILGSNSIAVPLSSGFPASELRYILDNSAALMLLSSTKFKSKSDEVLKEGLEKEPISVTVEKKLEGSQSNEGVQLETQQDNKSGMMLYTSGTTSRPVCCQVHDWSSLKLTVSSQKGVLLPESVLTAQSQSLIQAWDYTPKDHLLHVLPLHHIHGTVNALLTPLFAGSTIEFLFPFNVQAVWERFAAPFVSDPTKHKDKITFFTVVPTIYNRLLSSHPELDESLHKATKEALRPANLRLNISGSAALPTPTKSAWTDLSGGNVLLERYGMTEVGMALSCGLDFADRVDGSVGWPLPFVEARLVDTETGEVIKPGEEVAPDGREREGEIQLRGPTVFKEYWRNPKATAEEFVDDDEEDGKGRWFKTGDVATRKTVEGAGKSAQDWAKGPMYFVRGRKSVDIIKSGGEKVSALEIERELLSLSVTPHLMVSFFPFSNPARLCSGFTLLIAERRRPQIVEAAVLGVASPQWGQKVAAVVVLHPDHAQTGRGGKTWGVMDMRRALKDRLANYKIPQELKVLDSIPKNAMGKINKKALVKETFGEEA